MDSSGALSTGCNISSTQPENNMPTSVPGAQPVVSEQLQQDLLTDIELREKIVEVLSHTANGCLSELGYFPGVAQKLKQLEVTNQTWQSENVKLYDDNRNLLNTVLVLREQLSLVPALELDKNNRIHQLELEVQRLKELAARKEPLHKEFNRLRDSYEGAVHEVQRLSSVVQVQNPSHLQPSQTAPPKLPTQFVGSRQVAYTTNMQVVHPQLHPSSSQPRPSVQTQHIISAQVANGGQPYHPATQPVQQRILARNPLQQSQQASLHRRQVQDPIHPNPRRWSVGGTVTSHQPLVHNTHAQVASSRVEPAYAALPQPYQPIQPPFNATGQGPVAVQTANFSLASYPNTPVYQAPHVEAQPTEMSIISRSSPAARVRSAPLRLDLTTATTVEMVPTPPPSASSSYVPGPFSAPAGVSPNDSRPPTIPLPTRLPRLQSCVALNHPPPIITTASPNDIYTQPPPAHIARAPSCVGPIHGIPPFNVSQGSHHAQASSTTMLTTVSPQDLELSPLPSRKRDNLHLSDDFASQEAGEREKRARIDNPRPDVTSVIIPCEPPMAQPLFAPVASGPLSAAVLDISVDNLHGMDDQDPMDGVEDEEEMIEVGPDGLRLIRDCLAELFEDNSDGIRTCKLCLRRYEQSHLSAPPSPFVNAPDDVLEAHCTTEHEQVWKIVRQVES